MIDSLIFIKQLGKGKYGNVHLVDIHEKYFESLNINADTQLALKIINKSAKHAYSTWKNEIAIMKHINELLIDNPSLGVPKLYDFWEDHCNMYLLMDAIIGKNISQMIEEETNITDKQINCVIQVCKQLNRLSIKHRDFKPKNVLWDEKKNRWFLIDFGCSRITKVPVADNYEIFRMKIKELLINKKQKIQKIQNTN